MFRIQYMFVIQVIKKQPKPFFGNKLKPFVDIPLFSIARANVDRNKWDLAEAFGNKLGLSSMIFLVLLSASSSSTDWNFDDGNGKDAPT